jgi:diguanylate cyclase (GGDEF)-like protein
MDHLLERKIEFFQVEKRLVHKSGRAIWVLLNSSLVTDKDGMPMYLIGQVQDITSRKETEKRLEYLATHDPLTGLPNRTLFLDRLGHAINLAKRRQTRLAVLFLDLDSFKFVNDNYGHDTGDRVLQSLGSRMAACLRQSDTVARIGGDEFAFILENISDHESIIRLVEKISTTIMEPVAVNGESIQLIPSIGVALFPEGGNDIRTLMIAADKAMYRARETNTNGYGFAWGEKSERTGS